MTGTLVKADDRATFVKARLIEINRSASDLILENAALLAEYKSMAYYKEDGYESFDHAITCLQNQGLVDYGPRQARNFIAIAALIEKRGLPASSISDLGMSKLREIASLPASVAEDQGRLLDAAKELSVADVQKQARQLRDKAYGRESDPLEVIVLKTTATQKQMFDDCIRDARKCYSLPDEQSEAAVLVDAILADWRSGIELPQ